MGKGTNGLSVVRGLGWRRGVRDKNYSLVSKFVVVVRSCDLRLGDLCGVPLTSGRGLQRMKTTTNGLGVVRGSGWRRGVQDAENSLVSKFVVVILGSHSWL